MILQTYLKYSKYFSATKLLRKLCSEELDPLTILACKSSQQFVLSLVSLGVSSLSEGVDTS